MVKYGIYSKYNLAISRSVMTSYPVCNHNIAAMT